MPLEVISRRRAIAQALTVGVLAGASTPGWATTEPLPTLLRGDEDALRALDAAQRLTVEVEINDQGPFPFMIDTGANSSAISRDLAMRLGLSIQGKVMLHGIAGQVLVDQVGAASVRTRRRLVRDMKLALVDDPAMKGRGLLGQDWLGDANILIDYGHRRMVVGGALPIPTGATVAAPMRLKRSGLALVDGSIPGRYLLAFLDSGSNATIGNLALLEAARATGNLIGDPIDIKLLSVTGQTLPGALYVLARVQLGGVWLRRLPVVMGQIHTFGYWGLNDQPALLIGADVLQKFASVAMDYRRGEVRFTL